MKSVGLLLSLLMIGIRN